MQPEKCYIKKFLAEAEISKFGSKSLCEEALDVDFWANKFKTGSAIRTWEQIPKDQITQEFCDELVKKSEYALCGMPEKFINHDLIVSSLKTYPRSVGFIPDEMMTQEYADLAIELDPSALFSIPKEFINQELCDKAMRANPNVLEYVPDEYKTEEMCIEAVRKDGDNLQYVPYDMRNEHICYVAIQNTFFDKIKEYIPAEHEELLQMYSDSED